MRGKKRAWEEEEGLAIEETGRTRSAKNNSKTHSGQPSFFKIMLGDYQKTIAMPPKFSQFYGNRLGRIAQLHDSDGRHWKVEIFKKGNRFYFSNGWEKFVSEHSIVFGEFLIFSYAYNSSRFSVRIFGRSGCERESFSKSKGQDLASEMMNKKRKVGEKTTLNYVGKESPYKRESDGSEKMKKRKIGENLMPKLISKAGNEASVSEFPKTRKSMRFLNQSSMAMVVTDTVETSAIKNLANSPRVQVEELVFVSDDEDEEQVNWDTPLARGAKKKMTPNSSSNSFEQAGNEASTSGNQQTRRITRAMNLCSSVSMMTNRAEGSLILLPADVPVVDSEELGSTEEDGGKPSKDLVLMIGTDSEFKFLPHSEPLFRFSLVVQSLTFQMLPEPIQHIQFHRGPKRKVIILHDPTTRMWPVLYIENTSFAGFFSGWEDFTEVNGVREGDSCHFDLAATYPEILLTVQICKASETCLLLPSP